LCAARAVLLAMRRSMWQQILYKIWQMIMALRQMFLTSQSMGYALRALSNQVIKK
jgi:hypothetical protein